MGASAYIGRVGGLAVALGIGAAVATGGHGVAWADDSDTGSSSSSSESSSSSASESSSPGSSSTASSASSETSAGTTATESRTTGAASKDTEVDDEKATSDDDTVEEETDADEADADDDTAPTDEDTAPADEDTGDSDSDPVMVDQPAAQPPQERARERADSDSDTATPHATARSVTATVAQEEHDTTRDVTDDAAEPAAEPVARALAPTTEQEQPQTFVTTMQTAAPVALAAPAAPAPQTFLQRVVVNVLSSLGIGQLVSKLPGAPLWSPAVMALLGLGSRREFGQPTTSFAKALADVSTTAVVTYPASKRTPQYISPSTYFIDFVTGAGNLNDTFNRFGIGGTDLGIMWDNGIADNPATTDVDEHQVLIAFGDTFSNGWPNVRTGVWRFNTLFRSADGTLNNGLYVPNGVPYNHFSGSPMEKANWSDPILPSPGQPVHPPYAIGPEVTIIPTAGVSTPYPNAYGARQYMSFMSVRSWDTPGRWTTNYSGVAYSDDNGQTWRIAPTSIRTAALGRATVPYVSGNQNFQQGAFVKPPAGSPEAAGGWVYAYGTPSGRGGTLYLSRVQETQILDVSKYEYWNGSAWVANTPSAAKPILPGTTTSFFGFFKQTTYPAVSEMSVQYNPYLKKYVMLYGDSSNRIVMRTADTPQGAWSTAKVLVNQYSLSGKYAPYIHPWSGTDNVPAAEQQYLFWNLSTWNDYQVRLMRTDLTKV